MIQFALNDHSRGVTEDIHPWSRILFPGRVPRQYGSVIGVVEPLQTTVQVPDGVIDPPPVKVIVPPLFSVPVLDVLRVSVPVPVFQFVSVLFRVREPFDSVLLIVIDHAIRL